jgi:hypothetical protein
MTAIVSQIEVSPVTAVRRDRIVVRPLSVPGIRGESLGLVLLPDLLL